jgi:hypothetical protein
MQKIGCLFVIVLWFVACAGAQLRAPEVDQKLCDKKLECVDKLIEKINNTPSGTRVDENTVLAHAHAVVGSFECGVTETTALIEVDMRGLINGKDFDGAVMLVGKIYYDQSNDSCEIKVVTGTFTRLKRLPTAGL